MMKPLMTKNTSTPAAPERTIASGTGEFRSNGELSSSTWWNTTDSAAMPRSAWMPYSFLDIVFGLSECGCLEMDAN
jgi:hypothetical protein